MQVKYDWQTYEMTVGHALSFEMQKLWFPWRRFLRAVKRCLLSLKNWLPTLAVFTPIAVLLLAILCKAGLLKPDEVVVELTLVYLGSFMLLAIREIREQEAIRHRNLVAQWDFCTDISSRFGRDFEILGQPFGAHFSKWGSFAGYSSLDEALKDVQSPQVISDSEKERLKNSVDDIVDAIRSIKSEVLRDAFVDCDFANGKSYLIPKAESLVMDLEDYLASSDYRQAADAVKQLSHTCLWIVADLRKPWRFGMDVARGKLLARYVEQYGIEVW